MKHWISAFPRGFTRARRLSTAVPASLESTLPSSATVPVVRHFAFTLLSLASLVFFHAPLMDLVTLAYRSDYYSHTVVIPFLAGYLIYRQRRHTFACTPKNAWIGIPLLVSGTVLFILLRIEMHSVGEEMRLSMAIFSAVLFWIGAFAFSYGVRAFRATLFPLLLLFLMVPLPMAVMETFVYLTRVGSADIASLIFAAVGVPVYRHGFLFVLPGVSIEIAKECSGIHSTVALFVLTLVSSYLFLRSSWKRVFLLAFVFPIVSLTNGLRIATLTLIAEYFDKDIFTTSLHRDGGVFFFLLACVLVGLILRLLQERARPTVRMHRLSTLSHVAGVEYARPVGGHLFRNSRS